MIDRGPKKGSVAPHIVSVEYASPLGLVHWVYVALVLCFLDQTRPLGSVISILVAAVHPARTAPTVGAAGTVTWPRTRPFTKPLPAPILGRSEIESGRAAAEIATKLSY